MLITLIAGLVGIAWLRHKAAQRWRWISETRLDVVALVLLPVLVVFAEADHYKSDKELAATRKDLGEAQQKLTGANQEIQNLKQQVRDVDRWGPTDEQWKVVTANLQTEARVNPPPPDEQEPFITCIMGDVQSTHFAARMAQAFIDAGWKFKGRTGYRQAISDPVPDGVAFHVRSREEKIPVLDILWSNFELFGIKEYGYLREQMPPGKFDIDIGLKPKQP